MSYRPRLKENATIFVWIINAVSALLRHSGASSSQELWSPVCTVLARNSRVWVHLWIAGLIHRGGCLTVGVFVVFCFCVTLNLWPWTAASGLQLTHGNLFTEETTNKNKGETNLDKQVWTFRLGRVSETPVQREISAEASRKVKLSTHHMLIWWWLRLIVQMFSVSCERTPTCFRSRAVNCPFTLTPQLPCQIWQWNALFCLCWVVQLWGPVHKEVFQNLKFELELRIPKLWNVRVGQTQRFWL